MWCADFEETLTSKILVSKTIRSTIQAFIRERNLVFNNPATF